MPVGDRAAGKDGFEQAQGSIEKLRDGIQGLELGDVWEAPCGVAQADEAELVDEQLSIFHLGAEINSRRFGTEDRDFSAGTLS